MRFLGNIEAKTDAKGRVFLPASFRKVLQAHSESSLIMRKDVYQNCLVLYPESIWNEQLDQLRAKLSKWNPQHQQIFRQFVANVEIITLDGNGRLLIPKRFKMLANISQEVCFIGLDNTIEVWSKDEFEKSQLSAEQFINIFNTIMNDGQSPTNENAL